MFTLLTLKSSSILLPGVLNDTIVWGNWHASHGARGFAVFLYVLVPSSSHISRYHLFATHAGFLLLKQFYMLYVCVQFHPTSTLFP